MKHIFLTLGSLVFAFLLCLILIFSAGDGTEFSPTLGFIEQAVSEQVDGIAIAAPRNIKPRPHTQIDDDD